MRLRPSESGQTTVVMTLFLATFLLGFIAVGIDVEVLFAAKRQAQAAADAAALAAAEESPDATNEQTVAYAIAALNGFDHLAPVNPASVVVGTPVGGNYGGDTGSVQVVVSRPIRTFFAGILTHKATMVVAARAVAKAGLTSPTCVCLVGTGGRDLYMHDGAKLTATGCGVMVDTADASAIVVKGSTLGAATVGSVSTNWYNNTNVPPGDGHIAPGTKIVEGLPVPGCNPPAPAAPAYDSTKCTGDPIAVGGPKGTGYGGGGNVYNVGPGSGNGKDQNGGALICYTSLTVAGNGNSVTLKDGIYVIKDGTLFFNSGTAYGGSSITFYLTGTANLVISNGANMNLNAPTSGIYKGILVLQDPGDSTLTIPRAADSAPITIAGGANTSFNGTIFAPTAPVTLSNGSNTNIGADVVAKTLEMTGGTFLTGNPATSLGTFNISTAKLTE